MELGEFGNFVHQELCSLSRSEKVVTQLSYGLGIPKSIIASILTPYFTDATVVTLNDVCCFFEFAFLAERKF